MVLELSWLWSKNHDVLKLLAKCTPAQRKAILKAADEALVRTICECILNVLKETVPVSKPAKRKLTHKKSLIALAEKSTPLHKKKKILVQHGGNFLGVLLPPVLRVLSSILT